MLRANSQLRRDLGERGVAFLKHATDAVTGILRHVNVSSWSQGAWEPPRVRFSSARKRELIVTVSIGSKGDTRSRSLTAHVSRGRVRSGVGSNVERTIDGREKDICERIVQRASRVLRWEQEDSESASLKSIQDSFEEKIVADHLREHHGLVLDVSEVLSSLHQLAEQTYENRALTFGCILDPRTQPAHGDSIFPSAPARGSPSSWATPFT